MSSDENKPSIEDLKQAVVDGDVQRAQAIAIERQRAAIRTEGTPLTMSEAITRALCIGPMSGIQERVELAVRDYLAHKFQAAMIRASDHQVQEAEEAIRDLWFKITGEKMK
jgi:hypothetical protein